MWRVAVVLSLIGSLVAGGLYWHNREVNLAVKKWQDILDQKTQVISDLAESLDRVSRDFDTLKAETDLERQKTLDALKRTEAANRDKIPLSSACNECRIPAARFLPSSRIP